MKHSIVVLLILSVFTACGNNEVSYYMPDFITPQSSLIHKEGTTIQSRFIVPDGYKRLSVNGFGNYLRSLSLKTHGAAVHHYDGSEKFKNVHEAVIDMEIGDKNLQQCADAVMRLRAEYLFNTRQYDKIHFNFTSGFRANYSKWRDGYRIQVNGNTVKWVKTANTDDSYASFRNYLDIVFSYAGTLSLSKELVAVNINDIQPGDVLIHGGSPGHAVIVADVAETDKGNKVFMLAQSYMPAQEIEILKNPESTDLSPWYELHVNKQTIHTPEWDFTIQDFKRFP